MDARGLLRFTGRFKELIKGRGGEIIAPVPIEETILTHAQALSKVVIVGDQRDFNVALCTLQQEGANGESSGTGVLSGLAGSVSAASATTEQAMRDPAWHAYIRRAIQATNSNEKVCLNRAFRIRRFTILPRDFSIERDENTPTLKFKRSVIEHNYAKELETLYAAHNGRVEDQPEEVVYVHTGDARASDHQASSPSELSRARGGGARL
jgi:long-chain acyl-CoA synthetase